VGAEETGGGCASGGGGGDGVEVVGQRGEEEGEGMQVAVREAREGAERERVREHAEEVVGRVCRGGASVVEQGERVGVCGVGAGREARERGEEVREGARGGEAEYGETGVRLQDVTGRGVRRQERGKELPRVSGRVGLEGRGAPGGPCRRRRLELHSEQATAPATQVLGARTFRLTAFVTHETLVKQQYCVPYILVLFASDIFSQMLTGQTAKPRLYSQHILTLFFLCNKL
jgi:hypothetical protein